VAPRGLIVVNGYRHDPLSERPPQASKALQVLAQMMSYAVTTSPDLFRAVVAKLSGNEASVERYRLALLSGVGVVSMDAAD
jgi:hypothetical protein